MLRLGAVFILVCMVLIAASLGAVLYLVMGASGTVSTLIALAALTAFAMYNAVTGRSHDRTDIGAQIADLSRGTADLARQVAELSRRTTTLENQSDPEGAAEKLRAATAPVSTEIGELGTLVKQLAETVASHELKLASSQQAAAIFQPASEEPATELNAESATAEARRAAAAAESAARYRMIELVRGALDANRVDLYLQPIVTLPQRKVRYYEAFTRLRTEDGTVLQPPDFLDAAEAGGLMARIDHMLLLRSVQVVRRLQIKNRDIGLFCNIAASTLNDSHLFPQIVQFLEANRALASSLIMEFKQQVMGELGPIETESLAALRDLGFRFCIDQVTDLRLEPRALVERGIRYVKVTPEVLLRPADTDSDIHTADLSDLLGRFGVSLIAERIEAEAQVVDLLEYDVRFGQGFLFSPPRPVRQEALRGSSDSDEPLKRDAVDVPRDNVAAAGPASAGL
jgi:cyclic-di-GMP phosphodiesterase TipF (flagellum assembly factor)